MFDDIKTGLDEKGVKYTSTGTTITLEDGTIYTQNVEAGQNPEGLQKIEKTDNTATQSAIRVGDVETTTPPTNTVLVDFDPVVAPGTTGGGTFVPPPIEVFGKLIREGQITAIMALINPNIAIFPYLNTIKHGKDDNTPLGGYTQSDWVKVRDNEDFPQESRNLAGVIINARKSPDSLTSKIADCLGIELSKRARARQLQPGSAGESQFVRVTEIKHPLYELLSEATIDQFIDCNNVNKEAGQLLAYIGSMYASAQNPYQLGIVPDDLPSGLESQMDKLGFEPSNVGIDKGIYVFLDGGEQPPSDIDNIQVSKDKGAIPTTDVAPKIEKSTKEGKIFSTKENEQFPMGIENTQFYKDATKDGWSFINRKLLPKGTPFKTLPSLDLKDIEKLNYNDLEDKGKIIPTKNKGTTVPRIDLMQYRRKKHLREQKTDKIKNTLEENKTMKKSQLRKIIKESIKGLMNEQPDPSTNTISGLANKFLDVSKRLRKGEYKGIQAAEISEIDLLVNLILQAAMETNITAVIKRLENMVGKSIKGTVTLPGTDEIPTDEIPSDEFEDETI